MPAATAGIIINIAVSRKAGLANRCFRQLPRRKRRNSLGDSAEYAAPELVINDSFPGRIKSNGVSRFMTKSKSLPVLVSLALSVAALIIFVALQTKSPRAAEITAVNKLAPARSETQTNSEPLVGYRHKGVARGERLSNGAKDLGGGLLSDEDYGVSRFSKGGKFMLWLEKIVDRDQTGVPEWEVKDVLVFEAARKNRLFLYSYSSPCTSNGEEDLDLIVMAEKEAKKRAYRILKAWRANVESEKFEALSTDGISCRYDAD